MLDRVPTLENLEKRGVIPDQQATMCCFFKNSVETCSHLFISCKFYFIWIHVLSWFDIVTALAGNPNELLLQFNGLFIGRGSQRMWRMLWFVTIWSIWLHRNEILLNSGNIDFEKVTDLVRVRM